MNDNYKDINFSAFQCEPIELDDFERTRIRQKFIGERKTQKKRYIGTIAAAICLCFCISAIAFGGFDNAFAAVKQLFLGTGEYLGVEEQDKYACIIDETQTKGDYTVTLNTAIASNRQMRFNVTIVTNSEGKAPHAWIQTVWINGKEVGKDLFSDGIGHFYSPKEDSIKFHSQRISYPQITYNYEMPINPQIRVVFSVGEETFTYDFILYNEEFQENTQTVVLGNIMQLDEVQVNIKKMVITPIDQMIYIETDEELNKENYYSKIGTTYNLVGTNNLGENVIFHGFIYEDNQNLPFQCFLDNVDDGFSEASSEGVTSYELQWYNWDTEEFVGERFVVNIK